jgi:phospholipase C
LLDRHGIKWANYHHAKPWQVLWKRLFGSAGLRSLRSAGLAAGKAFPGLLSYVQGNLQFTADLYPLGVWRCFRHLRSIQRFYNHAKKGTLPPVSLVDPDFQNCSEENPQDIQAGEGFAASVINAVMQGPAWEHTLLLWFYDEHGGYYDHVPAPPAVEPDRALPRSLLGADGPVRWLLEKLGFLKKIKDIDTGPGHYDQLGFRVPAVVVSPYGKPGYVSSTVYDHTSALKLIENKWNLPPLTKRDAAAVDPLDMVDFTQPPAFLQPPELPAPARPWPDAPAVSMPVRAAQAVGLVGKTVVADASAPGGGSI